MRYDPKKHARKSMRLKGYDYSEAGMYHVVVRTKNGECVFGEVEGNAMKLSPTGRIAEGCWLKISGHFLNVVLDQYVVMPNHIRGIILIKAKYVSKPDVLVRTFNS
jgi:putative transposase